jgi:tripartite-type tricarboxylate transporter receptor subunit TctC
MASALAPPGAASAQTWPLRQPLHVIVSNTPGSALDVTTRVVFEHVSRAIGQTVVVENRPGGANTIAARAVAKAEADGYTVLATTSGIAIAAHTQPNLPYDTLGDFTAVVPLGNVTNVMVVPRGRFASLSEFVARAKTGALSYASIGPGSTGHLSAERFARSAGFSALHVPFRGSPEAIQDIAAGRVDFFFTPVAPALGLIRDGKIEALAVSSFSRSSLLPDVPTTTQAGFANSEYNFWMGVLVPAATPPKIVGRLYEEIRRALVTPEFKERLAKIAVEPMDMPREHFKAYLRDEVLINGELVKALSISSN